MKHTFLMPKIIDKLEKKCRVGTKNMVVETNNFFMPYRQERLAVIKLHSHAPAVVGSAHQLDFVNVFN